MHIDFEIELKFNDANTGAVFSGVFDVDRDGAIEAIYVTTYDPAKRPPNNEGKTQVSGRLFNLLKPQLQSEYEDEIIDVLADHRDSAAANAADLARDAAMAP